MAAWLKTHPDKRAILERVSFAAEGLWHIVALYCAAAGNNGTLPADELHVAVARKITAGKARKLADELIGVGLWRYHEATASAPARFELVDWLKDQPEADVWTDDTKRERWARGKALLRNRSLCRRIQDRDRNRCRYCGIRVDWTNRRGRIGGTYDHVDPDGDNDIRNVVVACRGCNGRKKDRTPAQAGMPLLTHAEVSAIAAAEPVDPATDAGADTVALGLDPDLTPIQPGSDPRPDPLACAREAGPDQNETRSELDRHDAPPAPAPDPSPALPPDHLTSLIEQAERGEQPQ